MLLIWNVLLFFYSCSLICKDLFWVLVSGFLYQSCVLVSSAPQFDYLLFPVPPIIFVFPYPLCGHFQVVWVVVSSLTVLGLLFGMSDTVLFMGSHSQRHCHPLPKRMQVLLPPSNVRTRLDKLLIKSDARTKLLIKQSNRLSGQSVGLKDNQWNR